MSLPEVLLWSALKANLQGLRFRRQHGIGPYIVDFYCPAARLVIEVEGIAHDMGDRPQKDARRFAELEANGFHVMRIAASDVLKDPAAVAEAIVQAADPLRQSLRDCQLPMNGEDL
jgi:very-short-patch-repair endonuclease